MVDGHVVGGVPISDNPRSFSSRCKQIYGDESLDAGENQEDFEDFFLHLGVKSGIFRLSPPQIPKKKSAVVVNFPLGKSQIHQQI